MRENIRKKMKSKEGFTLAELLIVVAIIAILAMISIPIFTSRMEKAKEETDRANERSAKAAAVSQYLSDSKTEEMYYVYDANNGNVDAGSTTAPTSSTVVEYGQQKDNEGKVIMVKIDKDGAKVTVSWITGEKKTSEATK